MSIVEDLAKALAWKAHGAVHMALHYPSESVTEVEVEIEKGFDSVNPGPESPENEE